MAMSVENYRQMLVSLLPRGKIWNSFKERTSLGSKFLESFAVELNRCEAFLWKLPEEAFPDTTDLLFYRWLSAWGIPDDCVKAIYSEISVSELRKQLILKILSMTYLSREFYVLIAESFGYSIQIEEPQIFTTESSTEDQLYGPEAVFTWIVITKQKSLSYFDVSWSSEDPLALWGDTAFECLMKALSPAHLSIWFKYEEQ